MKLIVIIASFILISNANYGQENLGFFDYEKVQQSLPYYIKHMEKIDLLKTKLNDSLLNLVKPFTKRVSTICINYTATKLESEQNFLLKQQEKIENFRTFALDSVQLEKNKLEHLTKERISLLAKDFCKLNGISFLSKKTDFLYCKNCQDYTAEFIKYISLKN